MFLLEVFDTCPRGQIVNRECVGLFTTEEKALQYLVNELNIELNTKGYRYSIELINVVE